MQDDSKNFALNTNRINSLSGKNSNIERTSLANVRSKFIRNEISSYLEGSKSLKMFDHNKKYLKEFSESDCFFQNKCYAEFLNDILMYPNVESIFYMCNFIFEKDIEALEKELANEEKQKFHFDSEKGKISGRFKPCLFVLALPNILRDIFSITRSDFYKVTKEDLVKRPEDLEQLSLCDEVNQIKSSMIYTYNVLKKKSENENNESKNSRKARLDYLKKIVLGTEKVKIKKFSTDNLLVDDTEKKFRFINYQKLIYKIMSFYCNHFRGLSELWHEFECNKYSTCQNADCSWYTNIYCRQYYTALNKKPEYFLTFNTLEQFDIAWDNARYYISTGGESNEFKDKYYQYLFIIAGGNQDKFAEFLEKKSEENGDPNMLYRCGWRSAILRVMPLILATILIVALILLPFILFKTILNIVFLFTMVVPVIILVSALTKAYYTESYKPFFAKHTPFEYKYNRYLQNKYPILKPENRDEHFFDESKKFQKYKERIKNEKKRFDLIATKYQVRDESIVQQPKSSPSLDNSISIIQNKDEP